MKRFLFVFALSALSTTAHASCGSSFCTFNTHWDTQGLSHHQGWRVDWRYTYAKADTLKAGSSTVTAEAPSGSDEELEDKRTINQVLNMDLDYSINSRWSITLGLPLIHRDHTHTFDSSVSAPFEQQAKFTSLGDVKVVAKYAFDLGGMSRGTGIRFGLKLPTGATNKTMTPPDPNTPDEAYALERSSQPGTGSTDAIVGAYYFRSLPQDNWGWFASAQAQAAISTRDEYRPGNELNLDVGTHYALSPSINALLQLNGQYRARDTGANANTASGGFAWYLSPGLSYAITPKTQLYSVVQIALKQYANTDPADSASAQLTAPLAFTLGVSHGF